MATAQLGTLLRHLQCLGGCCAPERADRELVDAFAQWRDESAFAALVARHGPMVLRVCRRVLGHEQDAEDAFQAAFLVLAQHCGAIRKRGSVADWLYGVAYRTAMKAKRSAARRRNHLARLRSSPPRQPAAPTWDEVQAVLDEEVCRLPEAFRVAFVLCALEGRSVPEAAAELGVKSGTVSSRLTRARKRLQRQLARRGIQLAALLGALSVAEGAARAGLTTRVVQATARFGLLVAAGGPAAGVIPPHVAALAAGVTRTMFVTKAKFALVALLAAGLLAATGALIHQGMAAPESPELAPSPGPIGPGGAAPRAPAAQAEKPGTIEVSGRVLDPDGRPVSGAKLVFVYPSPEKASEKVWATSSPDGRFHFTAGKSFQDDPLLVNPWDHTFVVAVAEGYGFAWARVRPDKPGELTLRLVKDDLPIQGRIIDLQGKPVAGATVRINPDLFVPTSGDLGDWLKALEANKRDADLTGLHSAAFATLFPPVQTGADGRFQIKGIGRERVVCLRVEGPTIATQEVRAMTRPAATTRSAPQGAPSDLLVVPTKPVVGVVRDKDTGKPLPGVTVRSYKVGGADDFNGLIRATTDSEGRYRLVGLPKGDGNAIIAEAYGRTPRPDDLPYLAAIRKVENTAGLEPVTVDIPMKRGVWVQGRVLDKATGKGMLAGFDYFCFGDNPAGRELPLLNGLPSAWTQKDGSYRTVALPGRGLIGVRATQDRYRMAVGAEHIKERLDGGQLLDTLPYHLYPGNVHTIAVVSPKEGDESVTCDIFLDPGRTLQGTVVGPDGKPLAGARVCGLRPMHYWEAAPLPSADFMLWGLGPDEARTLEMVHEEKKLAGWLRVDPGDKGSVRVRLEPWGTLTGRLVTPDGEPVTDVAIHAGPHGGRPDKDGKLRIDGFAPGLKYSLRIVKGSLYLLEILSENAKDLTVKPGETKDLGDIRVKPMP